MTGQRPDVVLDTRDLLSPLPLLRTKKAIDNMRPGQVLSITARDEAAKSDIVQLAERLKLELTDVTADDGNIRITIRK